jgi:hypothetical protein
LTQLSSTTTGTSAGRGSPVGGRQRRGDEFAEDPAFEVAAGNADFAPAVAALADEDFVAVVEDGGHRAAWFSAQVHLSARDIERTFNGDSPESAGQYKRQRESKNRSDQNKNPLVMYHSARGLSGLSLRQNFVSPGRSSYHVMLPISSHPRSHLSIRSAPRSPRLLCRCGATGPREGGF